MKYLIFLIIYLVNLNASILNIVKYTDGGYQKYILEIEADSFFSCSITTKLDLQDIIDCKNLSIDKNISKNLNFFTFVSNGNHLLIYPKTQYKIIGYDKKIYNKKIFHEKEKIKYLSIVFFKKNPSYFKAYNKINSMSFDINFTDDEYNIDVLNENLLPIKNSFDIDKLKFIQQIYKKKDYETAIKAVDRELARGNNFKSELLLLKIKALDKVLEYSNDYGYDDLYEESSSYLKKFSSNKHFSEVMYYKIKSLYKIGKRKKAYALTKRVNDSFKNDYFAQKALLLEAKDYFNRGRKYRNTAIKIAEKLLYNTKNKDIGLSSAFLLTKFNLKIKRLNDAKFYLEKILKSEPKYLKIQEESYKLAQRFASLGDFISSSKIAKILITQDRKGKKISEELLKNLAYWQEKSKDYKSAWKNYSKYLKEYPYGQYISFIKERMDKTILELRDLNITKKINELDNIMKKYKNKPLYKKAFLKKLNILEKEKRYKEILELEEKIREINATNYIKLASKELFKQNINENCQYSINLISKYKIDIDKKYRYKLANCYYHEAMYDEAGRVIDKVFKEMVDVDKLPKWYYLGIKTFVKLSKYDKALKLYQDLIQLIDIKQKYSDILYTIFEIYYNKKDIENMIYIANKIEQAFPKRAQNLDLFYKIIRSTNDKMIKILYAKKLLRLQSILKVKDYSPVVDIILIKNLIKIDRNKEALKYFASAYLSKKKTNEQKAQLLFLAGEASLNINDKTKAKKFFIKCGTEVKNRMWQQLCTDSLKLIDD